jgi:hypothetical protein
MPTEASVKGAVFGESFVPELRDILTSTSVVTSYGPDGKEVSTREQPFTHPWQLQWIGYDPELGHGRVNCLLTSDGKRVTAIIDAANFKKIRATASRSKSWNGSRYHDMAVLASTLIQEQVLTWDASRIGGEVHIKLPADR